MFAVTLDCEAKTFASASPEQKKAWVGTKQIGKIDKNAVVVDKENHPLIWVLPKLIPMDDQVRRQG